MRKLQLQRILFFGVCLLFACEDKDYSPEGNSGLTTGTWLLVERGYSPGFGYITEPVGAIPPQTLTFQSDGQMTSTMNGQQKFKYYFVDQDQQLLAFFENDPGIAPDPSTFTTSFNYSFDGNTLMLYFQYCIEGCHLKLRHVE